MLSMEAKVDYEPRIIFPLESIPDSVELIGRCGNTRADCCSLAKCALVFISIDGSS